MSAKPVDIKPRRKREGGPAKVDNGLRQTKFRIMPPLNQKNYYAEYLKRDSQLLVNRESHFLDHTRKTSVQPASQLAGDDDNDDNNDNDNDENDEDDDDEAGSRVVVLQLGSRIARIGMACDPAPKKVSFAVARKIDQNGTAAKERPQDPLLAEPDTWEEALQEVKADFKERMRYYKRRIPQNAEDSVRSFNQRQTAVNIAGDDSDDNDDDYMATAGKDSSETGGTKAESYTGVQHDTKLTLVGNMATTQDESWQVTWPLRFGAFNETSYKSPQGLLGDIALLLEHMVFEVLSLPPKVIKQYSAILIIPDLCERAYVVELIELLLNDIGFKQIAIIQEAVAASYGAGISSACIIDVGAQTSTVSCVDEGMIIPDSRVSLKYGGDDLTVAFARLMERVSFPYEELDLSRCYDFKFAEKLKEDCLTANEAQIAVQFNTCYLKTPGRGSVKYDYKIFDEVILPILGLFYPRLFPPTQLKLADKFRLIPRSLNVYDMKPNDHMSGAMLSISLEALAVNGDNYRDVLESAAEEATAAELDDDMDGEAEGESGAGDDDNEMDEDSKRTSAVETPSRSTTPALPENPMSSEIDEAGVGSGSGSTVIADAAAKASARAEMLEKHLNRRLEKARAVNPRDIPSIPLDYAIIESISNAVASTSGASFPQFYENLLVVGGGATLPNFSVLLTDRLTMWLQEKSSSIGDISVMPVPREMDPEIVTWKGGSVYARLKVVSELWISKNEWAVLGSRVLQYKTLFLF